jgi:hypothetical protein
VRHFAAAVFALGLIAWCNSIYAQSWGADARLPQPGGYATPAYGTSVYGNAMAPVAPQTTFDDRQQSVLILDNPSPIARLSGGIYPASATLPVAAPDVPPIYQPGQQFQLMDAPRPQNAPVAYAPGSPVVYNTIEQPYLPPGAVIPDAFDCCNEPWSWQVLPQGLIWHSLLAGPKEPRIGGQLVNDSDGDTKLDGTVGGRAGIFRYGNTADFRPQGLQVDVEGAAFIRQDITQNSDVDAYDFRIGFPVTYGWGPYQMLLSWYHVSAHLGDQFSLKHPNYKRFQYSRNALVWGLGYYLTEDFRVYGEVEYAYYARPGSPWAFQVGFEYSPVIRGWHGAPFFAINGYLKQETDFGGPLTVETGWQWRGQRGGQLIRTGFFYQNGPEIYGEFFHNSEALIGYGLWYDF